MFPQKLNPVTSGMAVRKIRNAKLPVSGRSKICDEGAQKYSQTGRKKEKFGVRRIFLKYPNEGTAEGRSSVMCASGIGPGAAGGGAKARDQDAVVALQPLEPLTAQK